jgi:hypothetical protein
MVVTAGRGPLRGTGGGVASGWLRWRLEGVEEYDLENAVELLDELDEGLSLSPVAIASGADRGGGVAAGEVGGGVGKAELYRK